MSYGPEPKTFNVDFWRDGCFPVSPGCENCFAHGFGLLRSLNKDGAARLAKLNRQSVNHGGTPFLIFVQDDSDVFADDVEEPLMAKLAEAVESAQAVNLVLSTRYLVAIRQRAPEHWIKGQWPTNLGLMVSVSNQREADRDIPALLALKAECGIPWVGVRLEPLLSEVKLSEIRLQALAHPRRRGKQFLNALTGAVTEAGGRRPIEAPTTQFGSLDWVTIQGERGDLARPLHPSWVKAILEECRKDRVAVRFSGWGEWANALHMEPRQHFEKHSAQSLFMFRNGAHESTTFEADRMEFYKLGSLKAGACFNGRLVWEYPDFTARRRAHAA